MATKNVRSIEEQVEDWCKAQLRSIKYYTKTESINSEVVFRSVEQPKTIRNIQT